jgi:hypothetical protein
MFNADNMKFLTENEERKSVLLWFREGYRQNNPRWCTLPFAGPVEWVFQRGVWSGPAKSTRIPNYDPAILNKTTKIFIKYI